MPELQKLNPQPARTDLTDRECSKLLGSLIGGLCMMADLETVREAVRWWAETDDTWMAMERMAQAALEQQRQAAESESLASIALINFRKPLQPLQPNIDCDAMAGKIPPRTEPLK